MSPAIEDSGTVICDLFREMNRIVTAYGPGAVKVEGRIEGTAFFPGGVGLWRGLTARGAIPAFFPERPVMILGHNFDKVAAFKASCARGIELMEGPTWLVLRRYLQSAGLKPQDCFLTNVFVGLQPKRSPGAMEASELFKEQCRSFLHYQIARTQPCLVVVLGKHAAKQFRLSGATAPFVELDHPCYAFQCGRDGEKCASIVTDNSAKLTAALNTAFRRP